MHHPQGRLFPDALQSEIKDCFHYVDRDPSGRERLFFENAGGSLRLKAVIERAAAVDAIPDCPERIHAVALQLQNIQKRGTDDVRTVLHAKGGSVYASLTASGAMFAVVRSIAENVPGTNMVTTVLEHPSSYDAMSQYAERTGRELRVVPSNPQTGGIDVDEVVKRIDADTCLLSVIYASNISGAKVDVETIVREVRAVKPDLFIVVDAVQHAPHGLIDLQKTPVDAVNFAPYKFFRRPRIRLHLAVGSCCRAASRQTDRQEGGLLGSGQRSTVAVRRGHRNRRLRLLAGQAVHG